MLAKCVSESGGIDKIFNNVLDQMCVNDGHKCFFPNRVLCGNLCTFFVCTLPFLFLSMTQLSSSTD